MLIDLGNHWAREFIQALFDRQMIAGFSDRTFRPNQPMTRAEFAALLARAFPQMPQRRTNTPFRDVPSNFWAAPVIQLAYERQFLSGYPGNQFRPQVAITRLEVWLALVSGLNLASALAPQVRLEGLYGDAAQVPAWAKTAVALATQAGLVINYPQLGLLEPNRLATRAEVGAIVYQALVYLRQAPTVASPYLVIWQSDQSTVAVSHRREFRAAWIATVWQIDWPTQPGLDSRQQQQELLQLFDRLQELRFNAVVFQVRVEGDTFYSSELEPWSHWLTGTQGQPPQPFYDPLEFAIQACRERNLELHAWFNPYRARTKNTRTATSHISNTNPSLVVRYGDLLWMDPGQRAGQDHTYRVIMDVVQRYDIDGVHLDDYFYPYPIAGQSFPDQNTYTAYRNSGGQLSLADWRRENVNQMVLRLYRGIKSLKPHVKFGISPFGIYRPGQPPGVKGLDQYEQLFADPKKWLVEGWLDYMAPQLYWPIDTPNQSYPVLLDWWLDQNPRQRHIYAGNNISRLGAWPITEIERQIILSRDRAPRLSLGNILYSIKVLREDRQRINYSLQTKIYTQLALPPTMPWIDNTPPPLPGRLTRQGDRLTWQHPGGEIRCWTLYKRKGDRWELIQILPAKATSVAIQGGEYALCAVDRNYQESQGVWV